MDSEKMAGSTKSPSEHSEPLPQKLEGASVGPLDWDGPDDPDNPWNWPSSKRWFGTIVPGCFCLLVYVLLRPIFLGVEIRSFFFVNICLLSPQNILVVGLRSRRIRGC